MNLIKTAEVATVATIVAFVSTTTAFASCTCKKNGVTHSKRYSSNGPAQCKRDANRKMKRKGIAKGTKVSCTVKYDNGTRKRIGFKVS